MTSSFSIQTMLCVLHLCTCLASCFKCTIWTRQARGAWTCCLEEPLEGCRRPMTSLSIYSNLPDPFKNTCSHLHHLLLPLLCGCLGVPLFGKKSWSSARAPHKNATHMQLNASTILYLAEHAYIANVLAALFKSL